MIAVVLRTSTRRAVFATLMMALSLGLAMPGSEALAADASCAGIATSVAGKAACVRPGETFKDCPSCPQMAVVPAGAFVMGSPETEDGRDGAEGPQHRETLAAPLAVSAFEITFAEWDACIADGGCTVKPRDSGWGRGRRPVINVSWNDVTAEYLPWLSRTTGQAYRLLSEAEWEYCARAGTATAFSTGGTISTDAANFDGTSTYAGSPKGVYRQRTVEVGSFPANAFGLYDMHGNVWEFVQDCYAGSYDAARPAAEANACQRVVRGGSWIDSPRVLRSAYRGKIVPGARFIYRGFRVARAL